MMSRLKTRTYIYCQLCILLICVKQIQSDSLAVSKEGLREEHLLPVRMARAAAEGEIEGSGDGDSPISVLNSNFMERMTLKSDDAEGVNKVIESDEESMSKETVESFDEGSGLVDATPKTAAIVEKDTANTTAENTTHENVVEISTARAEETTTLLPETTVEEEDTTAKETTETTTEMIGTTLPEILTTPEVTTEMKEITTIIPEVIIEETTTTKSETTTITQTEATTTSQPETTAVIVPVTIPAALPETTTIVQPELVTTAMSDTTTTTKPETTTTPKPETTMVPVPADTEKEPESVTELIGKTYVKPVLAEIPATKASEVESVENDTIRENLTAGTDTLLMKIKSRLLDTNETVLDSSKDPSRLGTYIVVSLILLSFLSLVGFILMKRRVQKRRKKSNLDPETLDTEKALLSLSEYKDHPDGMDEGKIKNNEITPIVIKSNSQINKFEKNTNFSSPKNLNTKANEKNIEKDNVLKKTSDNLTQVIIEDPTKDVEEEKAPTNAEKLIVRTHLDQDSIPKKPVIVNRTSLGCVPVSQD